MANITLTSFVGDTNGNWYGNLFVPSNTPPSIQTATAFRFTTTGGHIVTVTGTGFEYNGPGGVPSSGVIQNMTITQGGNTWVTATNIGVSFQDAYYVMVGWPRPGEDPQNGDSFHVWSILTAQNDVINGSNVGDDLIAGRNGGNDIINGLGGDDYIKGSFGNNTMDGGADFDTLSYEETFFDTPYPFRGAQINVQQGVVLNPWGGTDTISNFEFFRGSRFADAFRGDAQDNHFEGLRGGDSFIGDAGYDTVWYHNDYRQGGTKAIVVTLNTGKIIDGWGNTDTVSGIDAVVGSQFNDIFVGDGGNNDFVGWKGKDAFNGNGGDDWLGFWRNDFDDSNTAVGVNVNLSLASGQVINDGFGNKEDAVNFERVGGSRFNDTIQGNALANVLRGQDGNDNLFGVAGMDELEGGRGRDTMAGGADADRFRYNNLDESEDGGGNRDLIVGFQHGTDDIDLRGIQDANFAIAGDQDFTFIGSAAFTAGGQVRVIQLGTGTGTTADDFTIISANVNNNLGDAEFEIELNGHIVITAIDFLFT